ncbi:MAG: DUF4388 domain-containing protein [Ktedonobacteraceae bacterium]|nr:DUF4388 domain-containing protein [Ktedonobacteraceae bacterium]
MSFVSTLEQLSLAEVMQRLESHEKTGLLVIKQGGLWVELYFRQGRLLCIGPVRGNATLGDRLVQCGLISPGALQDALQVIRGLEPSETRIAIALMDLGHISREELRAWASGEVRKVLEILFTWSTGEIYFEEDQQPPAARLLVSLSVSSLILQPASQPAPAPVRSVPVEIVAPAPPAPVAPVPAPAQNAPVRPRTTQSLLLDTDSIAPFAFATSSPEPTPPSTPLMPPSPETATSLPMPTPVTAPLAPMRIDTSFMRPEMVLVPTDLSRVREQNMQVPLTPEQWRVFTQADGRTTLQMASQMLVMSPEHVCQVAGELVALGLLVVGLPQVMPPMQELSPVSRDLVAPGGYAMAPAQPWAAAVPTTGALSAFSPAGYIETKSQWGNGGNGATFILGHGWGMSQPLQPLQPGASLQNPQPVYAPVVGGRY